MAQIPSLVDLLKAGVHFGHQRSRWHPKMEPYLFGLRNGVHIIDLEKTQVALAAALDYVKTLASQGKVILFVGTKRQARAPVKAAAILGGMPYVVERWIGGLLTNFDEFKRRLKKYQSLKQLVASGEIEKYTKKEQTRLKKQLEKMDKYLAGLQDLRELPDALYLSDLRVEKTAVTEANKVGVPVVAVCDSNVNPRQAAFPIPGNDDAVQAVKLIVELVAAAVVEGRVEYEKNKPAAPMAAEANAAPLAKPAAPMNEAAKPERRALTKEEAV